MEFTVLIGITLLVLPGAIAYQLLLVRWQKHELSAHRFLWLGSMFGASGILFVMATICALARFGIGLSLALILGLYVSGVAANLAWQLWGYDDFHWGGRLKRELAAERVGTVAKRKA